MARYHHNAQEVHCALFLFLLELLFKKYVLETHRCGKYSKATRIHVGDRARTREFSRQGSSLRACSRTSPTTQVGRCTGECLDRAKEVAACAASFRPGYWCFFSGPGSEQTWTYNESRLTAHFTCGEWDKFASVMMRELITSNRPVFKCSNMQKTGILTFKERETRSALQKRAAEQSHVREHGIGVQSTLSVFAVKNWIQHKMPVPLPTSHNGLNQEEVAASAHHRPPVCAAEGHLPAAIRRFVPRVGMCLLNQRKNKWKNRMLPTARTCGDSF